MLLTIDSGLTSILLSFLLFVLPALNNHLTEFVPKFLARRAQAAKASASKRPTKQTSAPAQGTPLESSSDRVPIERPEVGSTSRPLLPAISTLPSAFHKRYLMNFAALSPEQQRAAQELERLGQGDRKGWGRDEATLRELSREGVLKREEVKAMLRTGPLQDFGGNVLQVGTKLPDRVNKEWFTPVLLHCTDAVCCL